jgi:hypothetical protein
MPCLPPACFAWHRLAWPNGGHAATTEQATARKEEIMQRTRGRGRHMHAAARGQLLMDRSTDEHAHTKPIVQAKLAHTGPDMLSRCPVGACPPLDKEPRHARARVSCPPPAGAARLSSSSIIAAAALSLPLGNARAASAGERSNSLSHACAARRLCRERRGRRRR